MWSFRRILIFTRSIPGQTVFLRAAEHATSRVLTLYTGYQLSKHTEALFDLESAGGRGISDALGMAGFTNVDVVRNPSLGSRPYIARAMLHQGVCAQRKR